MWSFQLSHIFQSGLKNNLPASASASHVLEKVCATTIQLKQNIIQTEKYIYMISIQLSNSVERAM